MKRIFTYSVILVLLATAFIAWRFLGSNTNFDEPRKSIFIKTGSTFSDIMEQVKKENIVSNPGAFEWLAAKLGYDKKVHPGKYTIENGKSIFSILRQLRSGVQTPVNLVITKLRTKEELAQKIGQNFECDSLSVASLLYNEDSLKKFGVDTNTIMTLIIPNTYSLLWTSSPSRILRKLAASQEKFWNDARRKKAEELHLSTEDVYTLASIVEEESNRDEDKGKIASVYINRIQTGMNLGADPTVKYAMRDFGLKRIYNKYLQFPSPYNTYINKGLPPGPICTPSIKTIDAVLDAPPTNYLYFVAKPELDGYSNFATTYEEHMKYAKAYQEALNKLSQK